jgi:hypothetical protein
MEEKLRGKALSLAHRMGDDRWELARVLCQIYDQKAYLRWEFEKWCEYLKEDHPMIHLRTAENMLATWRWYVEMPKKAQDYFRKHWGFSILRTMRRYITADNWREWKARGPMTADEAEEHARGNIGAVRSDAISARSLRIWSGTRNLKLPLVRHMALLRSLGVPASAVANLEGIPEEEVRDSLRMIQVFVPTTTLENAECCAEKDHRPLQAEICIVLQQLYDDEMLQVGRVGTPQALSA